MRLILILAQIPTALLVLYLDVLSVGAALWRRRPPSAAPRHRFALLVPAHDEERLLPRLLASVTALDYPQALYDVYVVADNCSDRTATLAEAGGAIVYERTDDRLRGKGYALRWLLAQVARDETRYDAYVILDADSVIGTSFLRVMNDHLARGDQALQSYYGVLNRDESWPAALRYVALALYNGLRPRGRDALGLSAGLRGNGMCFAASIIERFGWEAFTLAEDAEFHLQLVSAGIRVAYAAEATVLAEMPTALHQAHSQNVRWERGRLQMLRSFGPRLLAVGLRTRNPILLDAVAEQVVPPLSVLTGMTMLAATGSVVFRARAARRLAALVVLGQVAYIVTGLRLVQADARAYAALLCAPLYMVWKIWVYAISAIGIRQRGWVRTARSRDDV